MNHRIGIACSALARGVAQIGSSAAKVVGLFRAPPDGAVPYAWFLRDEVARYDSALGTDGPGRIDDQTWCDLELGRYLDMLSAESSIFGRQALYRRLRAGMAAPMSASAVAMVVQQPPPPLDGAMPTPENMMQPLRGVDCEVGGLLFQDELPVAPSWVGRLWAVPLALIGSLLTIALGAWAVGGIALGATLIVSAWVQIALHEPLHRWHRQRNAIVTMLGVAHALARTADRCAHPLLGQIGTLQRASGRLLTLFGPRLVERVPALAEYANLLAVYQYRRYGEDLELLRQELPTLRTLFRHVSDIEADLAIQRHLATVAWSCWVTRGVDRQLDLVDVVNPLLDPAQPLSLRLDGKGAFITGQNGVGKSTLLRTIGLNMVVARAFGFCYARSAVMPTASVATSIQIEDSLETGQSLYMAELRRARALLQQVQRSGDTVVIVDEIFRGTNHLESVAGAASVLHELAKRSLVLVSSHNLALAALLANDLEAVCVARVTQAGGSELLIEPGVLAETNGLAMLSEFGFPQVTLANAKVVFDWYAGHMTNPGVCPRWVSPMAAPPPRH